jgi:hypothetical protein
MLVAHAQCRAASRFMLSPQLSRHETSPEAQKASNDPESKASPREGGQSFVHEKSSVKEYENMCPPSKARVVVSSGRLACANGETAKSARNLFMAEFTVVLFKICREKRCDAMTD